LWGSQSCPFHMLFWPQRASLVRMSPPKEVYFWACKCPLSLQWLACNPVECLTVADWQAPRASPSLPSAKGTNASGFAVTAPSAVLPSSTLAVSLVEAGRALVDSNAPHSCASASAPARSLTQAHPHFSLCIFYLPSLPRQIKDLLKPFHLLQALFLNLKILRIALEDQSQSRVVVHWEAHVITDDR
jgi:hypothetical protein